MGLGITAESEKINTPFVPHSVLLVSTIKQEEAVLTPCFTPTMVSPARSTFAVVFSAPATIASALSCASIIAANRKGSCISFFASSGVIPLAFRFSYNAAAKSSVHSECSGSIIVNPLVNTPNFLQAPSTSAFFPTKNNSAGICISTSARAARRVRDSVASGKTKRL